jgi:hypothetical protein
VADNGRLVLPDHAGSDDAMGIAGRDLFRSHKALQGLPSVSLPICVVGKMGFGYRLYPSYAGYAVFYAAWAMFAARGFTNPNDFPCGFYTASRAASSIRFSGTPRFFSASIRRAV